MALIAFRIGELERRMFAAAARLDYEAAIELRDQVKELRQAQEEPVAAVSTPRVVDIFTKKEVVTPAVREPQSKDIDHDAVTILEAALEEVKAGLVVGVCVLKGIVDDKDNLDDVKNSVSGITLDYVRLFVGGAYTLAHDLLEIENDIFEEDDEEE